MAPNTLPTESPITARNSSESTEPTDVVAAARKMAHAPPGEEVCITGLAGNYPESENVHALRDNLFAKKNLVTSDDRRWDREKMDPELPKYSGKIDGLTKFDASFFNIHPAQAHSLDPMGRLLLEKSYEAIVDAGVNPAELRGTRTGVFVGVCFAESEPNLLSDIRPLSGRSVLSALRISYATRIAYWLQVNGPAYALDAACSSSMYALDQAYNAIREGHCDQAVVAGVSLGLRPNLTMQFHLFGVLSSQGCCKTFDQDADGYCRSEGVAAVFLQKTRDARRVYATVVYSKTNNDGFKEEGITFPSSKLQTRLLNQFYEECEVDPASVAWVEAHGTGTKVGDPEECAALVSVFCAGRSKPLPIGSVKSNMGHTEPVSGLCSVSKVIIAMETGLIPPNINFQRPKATIAGLMDGRLQVVTEAQPWEGGLVGVNSFGFGGSNAHVCLRWNEKAKMDGGAPGDGLTRLVVISGRTLDSVQRMINDLTSRPVDAELVYLYHALAAHETPAHVYRGYALLGGSLPVSHLQYYDKSPRPVWFAIPPPTALRRPGAGRALLALPPYAAAVAECQVALPASLAISLQDLVAADAVDDPVKSALAAAVMQIALVSVLRAVGVDASAAVGSGGGLLTAGYAAATLTAAQATRMAFYLALAMNRRPAEREAWLAKMLENVMSTAVVHSSRWLGLPGVFSASSFARCLLTPAPLDEPLRRAPKDAIVVHLAAGGGDEENEKRGTSVVLLDEGRDAVEGLLKALGNVYALGGNNGAGLRLAALYPTVSLPVSRGTPMISPHVRWHHERDWLVNFHYLDTQRLTREKTHKICVDEEKHAFYKGHVVDGRNLFPATGYLFLVWECMIQNSLQDSHQYSHSVGKVAFENIRFHRATTLPASGDLELLLSIQKISGNFEIVESGAKVVTGRVYFVDACEKEQVDVSPSYRKPEVDEIELSAKDIYKELRLRGYNYGGLFRSLVSSDLAGERGKIRWSDNWVAFMDNMLQMQILSKDTRSLYVPTSILRVTIDAAKHLRAVEAFADTDGDAQPILDVLVVKEVGLIRSGGIEIRGLTASVINKKKDNAEPVLEAYSFLPNKIDGDDAAGQLSLTDALRACVHVGLENRGVGAGVAVKVAELVDAEQGAGAPLAPTLAALLADLPLLQVEILLLSSADESAVESSLVPCVRLESNPLAAQEGCAFVLASRLLRRPDVLRDALAALANDGFLLAREAVDTRLDNSDAQLQLLNEYRVGDEKLMLLRKRCPPLRMSAVSVREEDGAWIAQAQETLRECRPDQRVVLFAQDEPLSGLLGAFNCLRSEHSGEHARCVLILDASAPAFDLELPLYSDQLALDLAVNVFEDGRWGSFRHSPLEGSADVRVRHAYANVTTPGDLSSFRWLEGSIDYSGKHCPVGHEMVNVYVSALNFRDVMTATGKLAAEVICDQRVGSDTLQGLEFAGRAADGRRVMGMAAWGALSTMITAMSELLLDIPDGWTMEDAATVPVVYVTAMYALNIKGGMKRGDTVLIHSGTGGVGQAAIQLALHTGAVVFTTVGTPEKRAFIKQRFPALTDAQIGNSRDTSFEQLVMRETNGRGVDLVLNSLAEEKLQASVRCLAVGGRFLEIGKFDMAADSLIGMEVFLKETSFHGVLLDNIFVSDNAERKEIIKLLVNGLRDGYVIPLPRTIFPAEQVEQAFRYMGAGKHIGKVLLSLREEEESSKALVPEVLLMRATPRFCCQPLGTYVIAGGLGGFGLELADWLVLRGARQMVLVSRSGLRTGYQASRLRAWRSYGVQVVVSTADIATERGVEQLLNAANTMGDVDAIFNLAVVLRDALFENQTATTFATAASPKATATRLLDAASRRLCPRLAQFVVFSSVSCGRGNAGQTSYGAANSAMERVCEQRAKLGLPALAVQWGAVGQVGLVADMRDDDKEVVIGGTLPQRIGSCLSALDGFLRQTRPVVASMVVAEKAAGAGAASMLLCVASLLGIHDLKTVSYQRTLAEMGMDSMTAVEIKQTLEREYQVFLTPVEIRGLTLARVVELSAGDKEAAVEATREPNAAGIAQLSRGLGDERAAYAATVALPSQQPTSSSTLLMIPGLEGVAAALAPLAQNIDARAVCLQGDWVNDLSETARGMAQMLLPHALNELGNGTTGFRLLGYSFGGLVALHLAVLLEADVNCARRGQVFIVDGAPDYLQRILLRTVAEDATEDALQVELLVGIVEFVRKQGGGAGASPRAQIAALASWPARLDFALTLVPSDLTSSKKYLRDAADAALRRFKAVTAFHWPHGTSIQSPVTLLRPTYKTLNLPLDLGVGKYCKNPVEVHLFDETHVSILDSLQMATIINKQMSLSVNEEKIR